MTTAEIEQVRQETLELIKKSGIHISKQELEKLMLVDFGLGNIRKEGIELVDILNSPKLRITYLVLLPFQTLPEHLHPPCDGQDGKEETIRALYGTMKVYVPGEQNSDNMNIPEGRETFYTAKKEIVLRPFEQVTIPPNTPHWAQAGAEGAVTFGFYNRVNEDNNVFSHPRATSCLVSVDG